MSAPVKDCPQPDYPLRERAYTPEQVAARSPRVTTREDRGLPHHPDGSGYADCPACDGTGMYFHPRDRSGESDVPCTACAGDGCIPDGSRDPLLAMRDMRKWRDMPASGRVYAAAHSKAMRPSIGLLQLAMVERAIRCDVTMRDLLTTARRAA